MEPPNDRLHPTRLSHALSGLSTVPASRPTKEPLVLRRAGDVNRWAAYHVVS